MSPAPDPQSPLDEGHRLPPALRRRQSATPDGDVARRRSSSCTQAPGFPISRKRACKAKPKRVFEVHSASPSTTAQGFLHQHGWHTGTHRDVGRTFITRHLKSRISSCKGARNAIADDMQGDVPLIPIKSLMRAFSTKLRSQLSRQPRLTCRASSLSRARSSARVR